MFSNKIDEKPFNLLIMNKETIDFIQKNKTKNIHSLALSIHKFKKVDKKLALQQITGLQKIEKKVPTFYKNEQILYPVRLSLEQSSSEITATHKSKGINGSTFFDLTGGFGIDSYFLSQNFQKSIYIEQNNELCEIAKHNFKALNNDKIEVVNDKANSFLEKTELTADWIFIDPARRNPTGKKVYFLDDLEPNILDLKELIFSKTKRLMVKLSPMIDISILREQLPEITEIHIVATKNECKELIAIIDTTTNKPFEIKTFNYTNNGVEKLEYSSTKEIKTTYSKEVKKYLYEPNSAILKAKAYDILTEIHPIEKLHKHSHLFTSNKLISNFQGRNFEVEKVYEFNKKGIKECISETQQANLSTRNFPFSVEKLKKRLKIKDGGEYYLFATTLLNEKNILIKSKKVNS